MTFLKSPGQQLDTKIRRFMEGRFHHDFSTVKVHADLLAHSSAREVGARAYSVGADVVFGEGEYVPGKASTIALVAHELAHVVQSSDARPNKTVEFDKDLRAEKEASDAAKIALNDADGSPKLTPAVSALRRFPSSDHPAEPDKGACWRGQDTTPQVIGQRAHRAIQADVRTLRSCLRRRNTCNCGPGC